MRTLYNRPSVLAAALFAMLSLGAVPVLPGPEDLGSLGGSPFPVHVQGFGRNGTVVGVTNKPGVGEVPFAWTAASGFRVLIDEVGVATAANGLGQVVGYSSPESGPLQGFLWSPNGSRIAISSPLAYAIYPRVVNDAGKVAGEMDLNNGEQHAFVWTEAHGLKDIGSLGGSRLSVTDITEDGLVVGNAKISGSWDDHAFAWKSGGPLKDLGTLGGAWSYATAANDAGMIVGYSRTANYITRAFITSLHGRMTELASLGAESFAYGINASGSIIGGSHNFGQNSVVLWSPSGVPQEIPGVQIAVGINNAGQVAAYSMDTYSFSVRAYLWSAATGLLDCGSVHDSWSQPLGVTDDGRIVGLRQDWSGVAKGFVGQPEANRALIDGAGGGYSRALHINASGQVAGVSRTVLCHNRAFVWSPGAGMTEVPAPASLHSEPVGLNASGQVAGWTYSQDGAIITSRSAFFWPGSGAGSVDLGEVTPVDLNDLGQVVGYTRSYSTFVWSAGTFTPAPLMADGWMIPTDINNRGQVVGSYAVSPWQGHGYSWTPGTAPVDLGTLGGTHSRAVAVNDAGQIAGTSDLPGDATSHAFRMRTGQKMSDLGAPIDPASKSAAVAINQRGHVIGSSDTDGSIFQAFLYDSKMRALGDLGSSDFKPSAINYEKDVVGWRVEWESGAFGPLAFVCPRGGIMVDLPLIEGQESSQALAVNDRGEVVGNIALPDGQRRAVLWRIR